MSGQQSGYTDTTPAVAQVRGIHHLALGTHDVAALATFYIEVVGLTETARHHADDGTLRSVWLDAGGVVLMIERTTRVRSRAEGVDDGLFLFALGCAAEARNVLAARWEKGGAAYQRESSSTIYFRDPEGNRVALTSYPQPAAPSRVEAASCGQAAVASAAASAATQGRAIVS